MSSEKRPFWQVVRGICILAVILIHCPNGLQYGVGSLQYNTWMILRQVTNIPVATFIFISGYFVNQDKCSLNPKKYIFSRGLRLVIPFIIWSFVYTGINVILTLESGESINFISLLINFVLGRSAAPFYYILVLMQLILLTPVLIHLLKKQSRLCKWLWLVTPIYLIWVYVYSYIFHVQPPLYATLFPAWFIFYYLGLYINFISERGMKLRILQFGTPIYLIVMLIISIIEAAVLIKVGYGGEFACSQIKLSSFLYAATFILFLLRSNEYKVNTSILKYIGDYSYAIFYIHILFIRFSNIILARIEITKIYSLNFIFTFVITTILSMLTIKLVRVVCIKLKIEYVLDWIGF
jgi:Uncharacterized protein conserved in bacteria